MIKNKAIVNEENTSLEYWKKKYRDLLEKSQTQTGTESRVKDNNNMEMEMLSHG
jgi:hypothetical protein